MSLDILVHVSCLIHSHSDHNFKKDLMRSELSSSILFSKSSVSSDKMIK